MAKESVIVISEDDLEPEDEPIVTIGPEDLDEDPTITIGPEDLMEGAAVVITTEDIVEGDMRALFRTPLMRPFIAFVSAGLPDVFLRSHPELLRDSNRKQIKAAVDKVPDQALRRYLASRLEAIERFQAAQEGQA